MSSFEWDSNKNLVNRSKHGVSFGEAQQAFIDNKRIIAKDINHSIEEERFYCFGKIGENILTVRFTYRGKKIRIIGAGYWRKGKRHYEQQNKLHG